MEALRAQGLSQGKGIRGWAKGAGQNTLNSGKKGAGEAGALGAENRN